MPLIDKIGRSLTRVVPYLGATPLKLMNARLLADKVQGCRRRYILDRAASRKCGEIMLNEGHDDALLVAGSLDDVTHRL